VVHAAPGARGPPPGGAEDAAVHHRRGASPAGRRRPGRGRRTMSAASEGCRDGDGDWAEIAGHVTYPSRSQGIELAVQLARPVPGHIIEFGVWKGDSVRVIRDELWRSALWDRAQRRKRIYACDSFAGLPDDYEHLRAGTFATPVPTLRGVRIVA